MEEKDRPYVCEIVDKDIKDDDIKGKVAEGYEYLCDIDPNRRLFRKMWEGKKRKLYDCVILSTSKDAVAEQRIKDFVAQGYEFVCKINPDRLLFRKRTEKEK
jgi:hypothetical protein